MEPLRRSLSTESCFFFALQLIPIGFASQEVNIRVKIRFLKKLRLALVFKFSEATDNEANPRRVCKHGVQEDLLEYRKFLCTFSHVTRHRPVDGIELITLNEDNIL